MRLKSDVNSKLLRAVALKCDSSFYVALTF